MGQTENKTEQDSFLDIFELDHDKYTDESAVSEVETEVVKEGHSDATNAIKEEEKEKESVAIEEDDLQENKGSGKQAEIEDEDDEESSSEEDAPDTGDQNKTGEVTPIQEMMESLAGDGILEFDEEAEYEPTSEGLQNLIQETVEKRSQKAVEDFRESLPETAGKLLEVLEKGGTIEDFQAMNSEIDFSKVDSSNERNQGYLVEDWMKLQGMDDLEIRETLESYKAAGVLEKQAKFAQKKLHEHQVKASEERMQSLEQKQQELAKQQEADAIEFEEKVKGLKELKGFSLTPKKAQKLYDFITKPGDDGKTEFEKMDSEENRLLYAMFAMDGFDKNKLSRQEASKQVIKLKKKLGNYQDKNVSPRGEQNRKSKGDGGISIPWSLG
jgi:hypothetical protein